MIAGTLGLLDEPADDRLDNHGGDVAALDVCDTQEYLDDAAVQTGLAAAQVESRETNVVVSGTAIDIDEYETQTMTHTEWVADVQSGFVLAERTATGEPPFPWGVFWSACGERVRTAEVDTTAFIDAQNDPDVWFTGSDVAGRDDVQMDYHASAHLGRTADAPNIGVGFETSWQGRTIRGVVYGSGYVAAYNEGIGPVQFARFVREEILPHAAVPDEGDVSQQTTLGDSGPECDRCGRESDTVDDSGYCITCRDKLDEDGEDPYANLDTVTEADGGAVDGE
jgi:hypothetical protein